VSTTPRASAPTVRAGHAATGLAPSRRSWLTPAALDPRGACQHLPPCPPSQAPGRLAGRVITYHPEQGWSLLCNGVVAFDDAGALLPDGSAIGPDRGTCLHGSPDLTRAGHVQTGAPVPPGRVPNAGLRRPGPEMADAAPATIGADLPACAPQARNPEDLWLG
jgi:hypothetical protein